jgi:hypothetical protein
MREVVVVVVGERSACEELAEGLEVGGVSPTLRRFLVSGPFSQFSEALMLARVSSAVYILRAMVFRARRILSVCQVEGPS